MPSISDVYNELQQANVNIRQLHNDLQTLDASVGTVRVSVGRLEACCQQTNQTLAGVIAVLNAGFASVSRGFDNTIGQQVFTNNALVHLSRQIDTVICNLEKISRQTCLLLDEAHIQTGLEHEIQGNSTALLELYKSAYPGPALDLERREHLQKEILECCPPPKAEPFCRYTPCEAPGAIEQPPRPDFEEFRPIVSDEH